MTSVLFHATPSQVRIMRAPFTVHVYSEYGFKKKLMFIEKSGQIVHLALQPIGIDCDYCSEQRK